jgi:cysteine desulfurase
MKLAENDRMDSIYLDHNATTPVRPEVVDAILHCCRDGLANPASQHRLGQKARQMLEDARERIAEILGASLGGSTADRLVFTSGGTEANNLSILGICRAQAAKGPGHLILSAIEHACVIQPASRLLEEGWRLDTLPVTRDGVVQAERTSDFLQADTRLVSVLLGNHETGVLQPLESIVRQCNAAGVPVHTDAAQVVGKLPVDFHRLGVAAMSVAAHKFGGPVGIGALVARRDVAIEPILYGGPQQQGLRPGTEPVALAVGMRVALELWEKNQSAHAEHLRSLRDRFEREVRRALPETVVHGAAVDRVPQTTSMAFPGLDAQVLLVALDMAGVACSVGSACSSGSAEVSPTLLAMGMPKALAAASMRFSFGYTTTLDEVDEAVRRIVRLVGELTA